MTIQHCWTGQFDLNADTHPEATGPLAAPPECVDVDVYRAALRERFATNPAIRQQLAVLARHVAGVGARRALPVRGPFADEARAILEALVSPKPPPTNHRPDGRGSRRNQ
jgi:hypothetical protein